MAKYSTDLGTLWVALSYLLAHIPNCPWGQKATVARKTEKHKELSSTMTAW